MEVRELSEDELWQEARDQLERKLGRQPSADELASLARGRAADRYPFAVVRGILATNTLRSKYGPDAMSRIRRNRNTTTRRDPHEELRGSLHRAVDAFVDALRGAA
jgi:hypothetical protein